MDYGYCVSGGTTPLRTVPAGQAAFAELVADSAGAADPAGVGALPGVVGVVALELWVELVEFDLLVLALLDPEFAVDPFAVVLPFTGMHVRPELPGVAAAEPCGTGLVGAFCWFVPGVGACVVVCVSGPAAFVVIGVGGPIVLAGVVVVGVAGAAAGAGAAVCGTGAAVGGGAAVRLCATPQLAQAITLNKVISRIVIEILPRKRHHSY